MRQNSGQAAIIFILIIAIIFLFTAITVNVSKVAGLKNTVSITAEGAAIDLAAKLGSYSGLLEEKGQSVEGWDLGYIVQQFIGAMEIIAGIYTSNPGLVKTGLVMIGSNTVNQALDGLDAEALNRKLAEAGMDMKDQWREQAIYYALIKVVDDSKMVKDFLDIDEDGDRDEQVSRFALSYYARTNNIAAEIKNNKRPLLSYLEDFQAPLEKFRDDMVDFSGFLENDFIPLLEGLKKDQGIDVSFWEEDVDWDKIEDKNLNDDIDRLIYRINHPKNEDAFEDFFEATIRNMEEGVLITSEVLMPWSERLYGNDNPENDNNGGWYFLFGHYSTAMDAWLVELRDIRDGLLDETVKEKVNDAIKNIKSVNNPMGGSIQEFRSAVDGLDIVIKSVFTDAQLSVKKPVLLGVVLGGAVITSVEAAGVEYTVTYSWHDSRGNHFVRVSVDGFKMPELKTDTNLLGETTYDVNNRTGDVAVEVTRFDERQDTYLWNFRYTKDVAAGISDPVEAGFDLPGAEEKVLRYGISAKRGCHYYCGGAGETPELLRRPDRLEGFGTGTRRDSSNIDRSGRSE